MSLEAFYLEGRGRARFCIFHPARGGALRGGIVYIHPFAEEMNCSRRVVAAQARRLAAAGFAVLQVDLHGCGDSSGDFADATWQAWIEDVGDACDWLRSRTEGPLWLWGLRAGALVAAAVAASILDLKGMLLWQPVLAGDQCLRQFLRLRVAAEMLEGGRVSTQALEQQLAGGAPVEVAGYLLSPALAGGLAQAVLSWPSSVERLAIVEVSSRPEAQPTPALAAWLERVCGGRQPDLRIVNGPAFWQSPGLDCPALLDATVEQLEAAA